MSTILLAEDDPDIRRLIADKLQATGFAVLEAGDGLAALAAARRAVPDLVLLDMRMPLLNGLDVCRELRTDPHTADIPIIMVTAHSQSPDIEQAYAAGATDYLVKPFSPRELVRRVEAALAQAAG